MNCKKCGKPFYHPVKGVEHVFCSKECEDKFYLYNPRPTKWPTDERVAEFSIEVKPVPTKVSETTVDVVKVVEGKPSLEDEPKEPEEEPEEELELYVPDKKPAAKKKTPKKTVDE